MKRLITRFPAQSLERFGRRAYTINAGDLKFGQPLPETHPHLLKPGELTPGISALEFHHRRAALADKLPDNSIAVIAAADTKYRSGAVFYEYHQNPNFNYLTGFLEPDSLAIIGSLKTLSTRLCLRLTVFYRERKFVRRIHILSFCSTQKRARRTMGRRQVRRASSARCFQCR